MFLKIKWFYLLRLRCVRFQNKVQFDDFDVTGPGTMVVFAKNNGVRYFVFVIP